MLASRCSCISTRALLYRHFQGALLFFSSLGIRPVCYPSVFFLSFSHLIIHDYSKNRRTALSPDSWWRTVLIIHIRRLGLPRACFLICEKLWIQCLATRFVCVCVRIKSNTHWKTLAQCVDKACARNASAVAGWRVCSVDALWYAHMALLTLPECHWSAAHTLYVTLGMWNVCYSIMFKCELSL